MRGRGAGLVVVAVEAVSVILDCAMVKLWRWTSVLVECDMCLGNVRIAVQVECQAWLQSRICKKKVDVRS